MSLSSREPEYILETPLEKTIHSFHLSKAMELSCMDQVQAELKLLSQELSMATDILGKIRDSVLVLEQSLEVPQ